MDLEKVTLQDCVEAFEKNNSYVILNDGFVVGFMED